MQQLAFDGSWEKNSLGASAPIPYDHVGLHGSAFMQFTGFKDRHGKCLFEGDIVNGCSFNGSYAYGKVVRDTSNGGFTIHGIGKFIEGCDNINNPFIEIIGNAYEIGDNYENQTL
jgi:hypothetical protein